MYWMKLHVPGVPVEFLPYFITLSLDGDTGFVSGSCADESGQMKTSQSWPRLSFVMLVSFLYDSFPGESLVLLIISDIEQQEASDLVHHCVAGDDSPCCNAATPFRSCTKKS